MLGVQLTTGNMCRHWWKRRVGHIETTCPVPLSYQPSHPKVTRRATSSTYRAMLIVTNAGRKTMDGWRETEGKRNRAK